VQLFEHDLLSVAWAVWAVALGVVWQAAQHFSASARVIPFSAMHLLMQASLFSVEQALLSNDTKEADFAPAQPLALALVAFAAFGQHPALAVFADAFSVVLLEQVAPVFLAAAHPGPAWATDALKSEVRAQSEPQPNCPEMYDPPATKTNAAVSTTVALLRLKNPMHSSVSSYAI
jgi:hypothetical protein